MNQKSIRLVLAVMLAAIGLVGAVTAQGAGSAASPFALTAEYRTGEPWWLYPDHPQEGYLRGTGAVLPLRNGRRPDHVVAGDEAPVHLRRRQR